MTNPEFQEQGEVWSLEHMFTALQQLVQQHGTPVPPVSAKDGPSAAIEGIPPLMFEGRTWRISYMPPFLLDGTISEDMVDVTGAGEKDSISISLFRGSPHSEVTTMVTIEPLQVARREEVSTRNLLVADLAIANIFNEAEHKGKAVEQAQERILSFFDELREVSPEERSTITKLARALEKWFAE